MPKKSRPYDVGLHERLKDFNHAVNYVKAAAEDSMDGFLLALRDVAEATKGMSKLAEISDKNRENLYRMLSDEGNPRLDSLWAVVRAMGLKITVEGLVEEAPDDAPPVAIASEEGALEAQGGGGRRIPFYDLATFQTGGALHVVGSISGQGTGSMLLFTSQMRARISTVEPPVGSLLHEFSQTNCCGAAVWNGERL